jgi:hypothetical protein
MGANQNSSRNLAYIPKSTQIHSTKSRRAVERKVDNRTHAVMRLGEKLAFKRRAHDCKTRGERHRGTRRSKLECTRRHASQRPEVTLPGCALRETPGRKRKKWRRTLGRRRRKQNSAALLPPCLSAISRTEKNPEPNREEPTKNRRRKPIENWRRLLRDEEPD